MMTKFDEPLPMASIIDEEDETCDELDRIGLNMTEKIGATKLLPKRATSTFKKEKIARSGQLLPAFEADSPVVMNSGMAGQKLSTSAHLPPNVEELSTGEEEMSRSEQLPSKLESLSISAEKWSTSEQLPPNVEQGWSKSEQLPPNVEEEWSTSEQSPPVREDIRGANNTWGRLVPNLPVRFLLTGTREDYLKYGIPLYEASIKCDWIAAKTILDKNPGLVRHSITENGETALHVAASAIVPKKVGEVFVQNLVDLMDNEDLALENEDFNTALYLAAAAGNLKTVQIMVKKYRLLLRIPGAGRMLPLNVAALFGNYETVVYLYRESYGLAEVNGWTDEKRGWLLEKCVENDMFDIALEIVKEYPQLANRNVLEFLARKPEAFQEIQSTIKGAGVFKLVKYIPWRTINFVFTFTGSKMGATEKKSKALPLLSYILENIAKKPKKVIDAILRGTPDSIQGEKHPSGNEDQAVQLQKLISERIVNMHVEIQNVLTQDANPASEQDHQALQLQNLISEHIAKMHVETQNLIRGPAQTTSKHPYAPSPANAITTHSNRILFVATEMGNTKFVVELIRQYPDLIWKVNDDKLSIFHIAVKHRHEGIYNLLYEIGSMKELIICRRDPNDNNMLHLAGKIAKQKRLEDVSGVALQMQRELLWFKEVEAMIPPSYREQKNRDGLTPYELFTMEHKDLVTQGERWMKETANQCMVVAALIATIVFAAAFTIPGGYDQNHGKPMFQSKATFIVFVVADAISLFLSSASILMFLSILTSRYAERDFLESLPKKLMLGLVTLFLSITTMTVTFSVSLFVLYHKGLLWIPILIGVFAVVPVLLYVKLQYPLFIDVIRSTYGSRYLFNSQKHVLYYENPKV